MSYNTLNACLQVVDVVLEYLHQVAVNQTHIDVARSLTQDDLGVINKVFRCLIRGSEQEELAIDLFQRREVLGHNTIQTLLKNAFVEFIAFL